MSHYRFRLSNPHDSISVDVEQVSVGKAIEMVQILYGEHYSISSVESPLYNPPRNTRRWANRNH